MGLDRDLHDAAVGPAAAPALSVPVVEDDPMIGMLTAEMLTDMGYDVCAIATTEEVAMAEGARHSPDLMIVDERLREGSGGSAVDRILLTGRILLIGQVPSIFISGTFTNCRRGALSLRKPLMEADLVRAIQRMIGSSDGSIPGRPSLYPS